jgi:CysZ protein
MFDAAVDAFADTFSPSLRRVLLKSVGLALILIAVIGIALQRVLAALAESGATWAEQTSGFAPHAVWTILTGALSVMAGIGIITGALFLMPAVTAFVASFFVDEVADVIERKNYPAEPPGRALPPFWALFEGIRFALLALMVYLSALPFFFLIGFGFLILFLANSYLLGREYFELAAMRFYPPHNAKLLRKMNARYVFLAGMVIALFVSVPVLNLAAPLFATAFMVHLHKRLSGSQTTRPA